MFYFTICIFDRHTVYPNGTLYFPRVRPADEGSYRCEGLGSSRDIPAQTFTSELMLTSKQCSFQKIYLVLFR